MSQGIPQLSASLGWAYRPGEPQLRDSSVQRFLGSELIDWEIPWARGPWHRRVVSIQVWFLAGPKHHHPPIFAIQNIFLAEMSVGKSQKMALKILDRLSSKRSNCANNIWHTQRYGKIQNKLQNQFGGGLRSRRPATEVSWAPRVSPKMWVSEGVFRGVSWVSWGPGLRSVQNVCRERVLQGAAQSGAQFCFIFAVLRPSFVAAKWASSTLIGDRHGGGGWKRAEH